MKWVLSDLQVLQHVRLPLLSPKFLVGTVGSDPLIKGDEECRWVHKFLLSHRSHHAPPFQSSGILLLTLEHCKRKYKQPFNIKADAVFQRLG